MADFNEKDPRRGFSALNYGAVTPADTVAGMPWSGKADFAEYIYIEGAGNLYLLTPGGSTVGPIAVVANSYFWGAIVAVKSTGPTTATGITGFFNG